MASPTLSGIRGIVELPGGGLAVLSEFGAAWRLDGTVWTTLANGDITGIVRSLAVMPNGDLVAGGAFGGVNFPTHYVARRDGSSWARLGDGPNGSVLALHVAQDGSLIAGGSFLQCGSLPTRRIARWDGTAWSSLSGQTDQSGLSGNVTCIASFSNGDLLVGGSFWSAYNGTSTVPIERVGRWNGQQWTSFGTGSTRVGGQGLTSIFTVTALPDERVVAAGSIPISPTSGAANIAMWENGAWSTLDDGINENVRLLMRFRNGDVLASGGFSSAGGFGLGWPGERYSARWNGQAWSPSGIGTMPSSNVAELLNGDIVVSGLFPAEVFGSTNYIARWDGTRWRAMDNTLSSSPRALLTLPNGTLLVGGNELRSFSGQYLLSWAGTTFSQLPGQVNGPVHALALRPNGHVVVAGLFDRVTALPVSNIVSWAGTGSAWTPMSSGTNGLVNRLAVAPNGDIVASGTFSIAGGLPARNIARWNGTAWTALGNGLPQSPVALCVMSDNSIVAGGSFAEPGGGTSYRITRWNGAQWTRIDSSMDGAVETLLPFPNGELWVGGRFQRAGGYTSPYLAKCRPAPAAPVVLSGPVGGTQCPNAPAYLSVLASGAEPTWYEWQLETPEGEWRTLTDSPLQLACGGSAFATNSTTVNPSLIIHGCTQQVHFRVRVIVTDSCGRVVSNTAQVIRCKADRDCSGLTTVSDVFAFLTDYFRGSSSADYNESGGTPTVQDVLDFLAGYFQGC
ncbi:MAG: hypothetical protein IT438_09360 [Phycisphaerales bacterium]|nr:hypothetical protein [Phycisphaerales bacterium]